jgi:predicted esterase
MIRDFHLSVSRTARYHALGNARPGIAQVWFVLHGYGQLAARFLRDFEVLDDGSCLVVAPEGLSRFYLDSGNVGPHSERVGASWMTREDRDDEIDDYVRFLEAVRAQVLAPLGASPPRVSVLGFSQGAATAARWVASSPAKPRLLVLWGGALPPDVEPAHAPAAFQVTQMKLVSGTEDAYVDSVALDAQARALREHGVTCERINYPGGHRIHGDVLRRLAES